MKPSVTEQLCGRALDFIRLGYDGVTASRLLSDTMDGMVMAAYDGRTGQDVPGEPERRGATGSPYLCAVLAVGGYGRRELAPFSDIDLMVVARTRDDATTGTAESFFYRLWDRGINISHSFRTLRECVEDGISDLQTRTTLIDARFLAGNWEVFREFREDVLQKLVHKGKRDFVSTILREVERRYRTYGESVYLLEPNLKEGRGGLRDFQTISWLLRVVLRVHDPHEMVRLNILSERDFRHVTRAYDFLLKMRLALHALSRRKNDVLAFEFHDAVAETLGFRNTMRFLAGEIMLRLFYRKALGIMEALSRTRTLCSTRFISMPALWSVRRVTRDYYVSKNEITVKDRTVLRDGDTIIEAFAVYAQTGRPFSRQLKEWIRHAFLHVNRRTRTSRQAIRHFLRVLSSDRVYETLTEMHETNILDRFIPEFGRLRHLVIYEPFHRFTVDQHTLVALKSLEALKKTKDQKLQYLAEFLGEMKQEVLYLSILMHDIGKGSLRRHEEEGYRLLKGVLERFGLDRDDRRMIEFLVKNHILLSKLALTRDTDDPETVMRLADTVENEENLKALYLVTYADMHAVNPHFWTEWKAYLLRDLFMRTMDHIRGADRAYLELHDGDLRVFIEDMPERYRLTHSIDAIRNDHLLSKDAGPDRVLLSVSEQPDGTAELTFITYDLPGLFARLVGVLSTKGLNVLRARLFTGKSGLVVDRIILSNWRDLWWEGLEKDVRDGVNRAITLPLTEAPRRRAHGGPQSHGIFESFLEIDNESSAHYTICELLLTDRIGLLHDAASRFSLNNADIVSAVINTEEGVVHDVFYLQHRGGKLEGEHILTMLAALHDMIP